MCSRYRITKLKSSLTWDDRWTGRSLVLRSAARAAKFLASSLAFQPIEMAEQISAGMINTVKPIHSKYKRSEPWHTTVA